MKRINLVLSIFCLVMISSFATESINYQQLLNERNIEKIQKILEENPDNAEANYVASLYYNLGDDELGTNKDKIKSLEYLKKAADLELSSAELQYGFSLLNDGLSELGLAYINKAATQNDLQAIVILGDLYFAGYQDAVGNEVVQPNLEKSITYLKQAIEQGNPDARYTLGHIYLDKALDLYDVKKALELFEHNIDYENKVGHYATVITLLNMYQEGKDVEKNNEKLLDYYYLASLNNYMPANYTIGILQRDGAQGEKIEIAKDPEAAFINLSKAAGAGYIDAMFKIGEMYFKGEGIEQSDSNAYVWTAIAEELAGNQTNYSETILELIPKKQKQIAVDNKNHLRQFFSKPVEVKDE